jgi:hypothetical protein
MIELSMMPTWPEAIMGNSLRSVTNSGCRAAVAEPSGIEARIARNTGLERGNFLQVPGQVPPVANDPAHPYVPNATGAQPSYRIADLANPNLKPWVKEAMKKDNDEVLAGSPSPRARAACRPASRVSWAMAERRPSINQSINIPTFFS